VNVVNAVNLSEPCSQLLLDGNHRDRHELINL
jgi:hypothetical protein